MQAADTRRCICRLNCEEQAGGLLSQTCHMDNALFTNTWTFTSLPNSHNLLGLSH